MGDSRITSTGILALLYSITMLEIVSWDTFTTHTMAHWQMLLSAQDLLSSQLCI